MSKPNLAKCRDCDHYYPTTIFELCDHAESEYSRFGVVELHTIEHMRRHACGPGASLFTPVPVTR